MENYASCYSVVAFNSLYYKYHNNTIIAVLFINFKFLSHLILEQELEFIKNFYVNLLKFKFRVLFA